MSGGASAPQATLSMWHALRHSYRRYAFEALATRTEAAHAVLEHPIVADVRERLLDLRPALEPEYYVMALGMFSAGKSTFLNAFLGQDLLPEQAVSCTRRLTIIRYSTREGAFICYPDGRRVEYPLSAVKFLNKTLDDDLKTSSGARQGGPASHEWLEVYVNEPRLADYVLLDSPGFDDSVRLDDEHSHHLLARADCVLWLMPANRVGGIKDRDLLDKAAASTKLGILTNRDKVKPPIPGGSIDAETQKAVSQAKKHFADIHEWLLVDSRTALRARLGDDGVALAESGLPDVEARIATLARGEGARGKLAERHGQLNSMLSEAEHGLRSRLGSLEQRLLAYDEAVREVMRAGIEALGSALDALSREGEGRWHDLQARLNTARARLVETRRQPGFRERLVAELDLNEMQYNAAVALEQWRVARERLLSVAAASVGRAIESPAATGSSNLVRVILREALGCDLPYIEQCVAQDSTLQEAMPPLRLEELQRERASALDAARNEDDGVSSDVVAATGLPEDAAIEPPAETESPAAVGDSDCNEGGVDLVPWLLAMACLFPETPSSSAPDRLSLEAVLTGVQVEWTNDLFGLVDWVQRNITTTADDDYSLKVVQQIAENMAGAHMQHFVADTRWLTWEISALCAGLVRTLCCDDTYLAAWEGSRLQVRTEIGQLQTQVDQVAYLAHDLNGLLNLRRFVALKVPVDQRRGRPRRRSTNEAEYSAR